MKLLQASLLAGLAALMLAPGSLPWLTGGEGKPVQTDRKKARPLAAPKAREAWNFAIYGDRTGGPREGLAVLRQAVKDTALLDPDLVMTVGDLIQGYNTREPWLEEAKEFKEIMDRLPMPWFPVAGNHDIYWRGPGRPTRGHESDYEEHFGPLWYWFGHKNAAFIALYTDEGDPKTGRKGFRREEHIQMSERQIDWLRKTLEQTKGYKHVMVFLHHPRWLSDVYRNTNWPRVHAMLAKAGNVRAVFAGHIHRMLYSGNRDGIEYHVLATVGGHLNADLPQAGFLHHINMVSVREDGIKMSSVPVGEVFDPKSMTPEKLAAAQAILDGLEPRFPKALAMPWATDVEGETSLEIKNPSAAAMRLTLHIDPGKGPWIFSPNRSEALIPPGETRTLRFAYYGSKKKAFGVYAAPRALVRIELEHKDFRLSFPEDAYSFKLDLDSAAPPASLLKERAPTNGVLKLSGAGACVAVPGLAMDGGPFTVEGWLRLKKADQQASFLSKTESSAFGLVLNQAEPVGVLHIDGRYVVVRGTKKLKAETWHHLAMVYDGAELRLYVDGQKAGATAAKGRWRTNSLPLYIGADPGAQGQPTRPLKDVLIDDVRVSAVARYLEDFKPKRQLDRDGKTRLLLRFDRDVGPMVLDHSGQGAHGQRRGSARCVVDAY